MFSLPTRTSFLLTLLLGSMPFARADLRPETLADFQTSIRSELKGFSLATPTHRAPQLDKPDGAVATRNERYYRGSSMIEFSVLRFMDVAARDAWNERQRRTNPSWGDIGEKAKSGKVVFRPISRDYRRTLKTVRTVVFIGRTAIIVLTSQRTELHRQQPHLAKQALSNQELHRLSEVIIQKLAAHARKQS